MLGSQDETPYLIYTSKQTFFNKKSTKDIELLLWSSSKNSHYVLIKHFNIFMINMIKNNASSSRVLECHVKICLAITHTKSVLLPEENKFVNFLKLQKINKSAIHNS